MNTHSECPHYQFFATTQVSRPQTPHDQFFAHGARLREWCNHPKSIYPKDGDGEKLTCDGDPEKCPLVSEKKKSA